MKNPALSWLKIYLWFVSAFHILVGLSLNLNLGLKEWVGGSLYGATVDWSDGQFTYIVKPLGAFMIGLGVMAAFAARDPRRHSGVVLGFALLFTLRGLQRLFFLDEIQRVFSIGPGRSLIQMTVMLTLAAGLLLLLRGASGRPDTRWAAAA